ncbi:Probable LRR receptor-like serine/threonine-protein kinase [Striga hermonthica]|uniref:non-specific serine/threonine protein kinase n=1 Tax=Striga hermonthica TaxID=68872 RepID=A0A9N7RB82_STRHE|nr:Probable LRR receptor-like serine/threonine-protein kinase [Striga hermonthica]
MPIALSARQEAHIGSTLLATVEFVESSSARRLLHAEEAAKPLSGLSTAAAAAAAPRASLSSRRSRRMLWIFLLVFAAGQLVDTAGAQNVSTNATTDPDEARILNGLFQRWGITAMDTWNISGELCSGVASDTTTPLLNLNPGIKCDCSYNSNTTCHITGLRLYDLDIQGSLPDDLWSLTYLDDLDLRQNYFTGPISSSIGNLTRMQYLSFGLNALSGELPREFGLMTDLRSISITANNFSGPIPLEFGNLTRLEQMYIHGSGISGPIPLSFANLINMQTMWASDNELTGQIPDFIGNWSSLTQLRLQGNAFQGPIPPSLSNLTLLVDLRISDILNGSSSLEFVRDMTSLSTLILRNNNISGSLPSFSLFQRLQLLDLSFNNLTGRIPDSLFNHSTLTNLFLGSNRLTGGLPLQKSPDLRNIDLSYNGLSGSFPSWVREQNLQLNLVANNFTIEGSNSNALPPGLNCLQRDFPCNRRVPVYSRFAIKCGGPQIISFDRTLYERENETLGPATYYVTNDRRWAVSNAGLVADNTNPQYTTQTTSPVVNTLDSQLYQTARASSGSLRYYGLGLENGNYTVRLQFTETEVLNTRTWESRGRRVFDIYLQGNLEERDFDIRREAGGVSLRAVDRSYNVRVTDNYLEIHLFWAGKGTCCGPSRAVNGPLISGIRATANFNSTVSNIPPSGSRNRTGLIVGIVVPVVAVSVICLLTVYFYVYQRRKRQKDLEDEELLGLEARPYTFSFAELKAATNDFNADNKLGEGGFGPVYKGSLGDGRAVAVKQLSVASRQGKSQFLAEIATISAVQHRNLVKLYGCCIEGDKRLLVYEYLENKSLDQILFGPGRKNLFLDWGTRYQICLGVARGLAYLHEESRPRIVHRDVKASNILLDSELAPKISDFGLAKLYDDKMTHMSTGVAGTIGYLAPEYALRGHLTEKADVFSYGVVALEIVSGRSNSDSSLQDDKTYLLDWAWNLHESKREMELVDPTLEQQDMDEAIRIIGVALLCTQGPPGLRPAMSRVVSMICGDIEVAPVTTRPSYLTDWNFNDSTTTFATDTTNISTSNNTNDIISPINFTTTNTSATSGVSSATRLQPKDDVEPMLDKSAIGGQLLLFPHTKRALRPPSTTRNTSPNTAKASSSCPQPELNLTPKFFYLGTDQLQETMGTCCSITLGAH